jgi:hypothetical protein
MENVTTMQRARRSAWLSSQAEKRTASSADSGTENGQ